MNQLFLDYPIQHNVFRVRSIDALFSRGFQPAAAKSNNKC